MYAELDDDETGVVAIAGWNLVVRRGGGGGGGTFLGGVIILGRGVELAGDRICA